VIKKDIIYKPNNIGVYMIPQTSKTIRIILDYAQTIVLAVVLALVVQTYVAEARWIPSESMLPTLKVGDYLHNPLNDSGFLP